MTVETAAGNTAVIKRGRYPGGSAVTVFTGVGTDNMRG